MTSKLLSIRKAGAVALALTLLVLLSFNIAAAAHVEPVPADGNPDCPSGFTSFKIEPVASGTYTVAGVGTIDIVVYPDNTFDFTASFGIDSLIVKGGPSANIYTYDPAATSDTGLHAQVNTSNGKYYGLSHLTFCHDVPPAAPLVVSKTATPAVETSYEWEITKSVDPASFALFAGESATADYSVNLVRSETTAYSVAGTVTIQNPNAEHAAEIASVSDAIGGASVALSCTSGGSAVSFPYTLAPGGTIDCTYDHDVASGDDGTNTVDVVTSGLAAGGSASAGFSFAGLVDAEPDGYASVNVEDVLTGYDTLSWASDATWPQGYTRDFTCPVDGYDANGYQQVTFVNTATIVETDDSAEATVTLDCYLPSVTKSAVASFDRAWTWEIEKTADTETVEFENGTAIVNYDVTLSATGSDSNRVIAGEVRITNPHPSAALDVTVSDLLGGAQIDLTCNAQTLAYGGSLSVPANTTLVCTYSQSAESSDPVENVVDIDFDYGTPVNLEASAEATFDDPANESDACVDVTDTLGGDLGEVCAEDAPHTFEYAITFNEDDYTCGPEEVTNTATFTAGDTDATGSADATVTVMGSCLPLEVSKTVEPTATTTYEWEIAKSVDPDEDSLFAGQATTATYTVDVTRTETNSYGLSGVITIVNPNETMSATIDSVTDAIGGTDATVSCETAGGDAVTFPFDLDAGETLTCTYEADLDSSDAGENVVTVETTGHIEGGSATVPFDFEDVEPTVVGDAEIGVTDVREGRDDITFDFADSGSESYDDEFACPADLTEYEDGHLQLTFTNTASIDGTDDSATATFTLDCYALEVSKTAESSFDRAWTWAITKTADVTEVTFANGAASVNYEVTVDATAADSNNTVSGTVTIVNPNPDEDATFALSDLLGSTEVELTCDGATVAYGGSVTVPAGETLVCTYEVEVDSSDDVENVVSFTLFGVDYEASAEATFGDPASESDACVDVTDTFGGDLGTVCADDAPQTFTYTETFDEGDYECGVAEVTNTATFTTNDTGATGSDSWTVDLELLCGCTYTQGYWKTHADPNRKQFDETWNELANGANTDFFGSGATWLEVFNTPVRGNAYYSLAHQYMAAYLNSLSGAAVPAEVQEALDWAEDAFTAHPSPSDSFWRTSRQQANAYASLLDQYNNGGLGVAHCD